MTRARRPTRLTAAAAILVALGLPVAAGAAEPSRPEKADPSAAMIEVLRGYLELIERYDRIARDPGASSVAAVLMAEEILKGRGPEEAIGYYTKILPEVKNEAAQRAIRFQLADLYKNTGQADKALEQLRVLITSAPPDVPRGPPVPPRHPPAPPQPGRDAND